MSEAYVECLVKSKPNTGAKVLRVILFIIAGVSVPLMIVLSPWMVVLAIAAGFGGYMAGQYTEVEYEYLYLDKELTIDKIFNQSRRKRVAKYSFEKIEVIAPIKSYHLDNFGRLSDKPKDYSIGIEEQPDKRFVIFYEGKEQILFSPSEELVKVMKNAAPRKVFAD